MLFAILGKNKQISLQELQYIQPTGLKQMNDFIVTFETEHPERLSQLGGIIKWGRVVEQHTLEIELQDTKMIGINNEDIGKQLKKEGLIRRFKLVKLGHTDLEIKKKGKELIKIDTTHFGIVEGYQNIELYEIVDFGKPARSMHMGMMPAKLAHIMINIGLSNVLTFSAPNVLIYDPFVGSGTTGFLANFLGYDFLGSDIDTKSALQNLPRRKTTKFYHPDKQFEIFQHDITTPLNHSKTENLLIISEGWLGPIVTVKSTPQQVQVAQSEVEALYSKFIDFIKLLSTQHSTFNAVFTIPRYVGTMNTIEDKIQELCKRFGLNCNSVAEVYKREDQHIGRKIIIIQSK